MIKDCIDYARQFHGDYIHQALELLHPTVPSWSFEACGMAYLTNDYVKLPLPYLLF